jgi:hypothetical protein
MLRDNHGHANGIGRTHQYAFDIPIGFDRAWINSEFLKLSRIIEDMPSSGNRTPESAKVNFPNKQKLQARRGSLRCEKLAWI